jgi:hypothetical protein
MWMLVTIAGAPAQQLGSVILQPFGAGLPGREVGRVTHAPADGNAGDAEARPPSGLHRSCRAADARPRFSPQLTPETTTSVRTPLRSA